MSVENPQSFIFSNYPIFTIEGSLYSATQKVSAKFHHPHSERLYRSPLIDDAPFIISSNYQRSRKTTLQLSHILCLTLWPQRRWTFELFFHLLLFSFLNFFRAFSCSLSTKEAIQGGQILLNQTEEKQDIIILGACYLLKSVEVTIRLETRVTCAEKGTFSLQMLTKKALTLRNQLLVLGSSWLPPFRFS